MRDYRKTTLEALQGHAGVMSPRLQYAREDIAPFRESSVGRLKATTIVQPHSAKIMLVRWTRSNACAIARYVFAKRQAGRRDPSAVMSCVSGDKVAVLDGVYHTLLQFFPGGSAATQTFRSDLRPFDLQKRQE